MAISVTLHRVARMLAPAKRIPQQPFAFDVRAAARGLRESRRTLKAILHISLARSVQEQRTTELFNSIAIMP